MPPAGRPGVGAEVLWPELLFFVGFGAVLMLVAYLLFKKRIRS